MFEIDPDVRRDLLNYLIRNDYATHLTAYHHRILEKLDPENQRACVDRTIEKGYKTIFATGWLRNKKPAQGQNPWHSQEHDRSRNECYDDSMDTLFDAANQRSGKVLERATDGMTKRECFDMAVSQGVNRRVLEPLFGAMGLEDE